MGEPGQCEQAAGQHPALTCAHPPGRDTDVEHGDRETHREGELPRHRRHDVAAVDVERSIEQEREGHDRQQRRAGEGEATEAPGRIRGEREGDDARDRDQLHRHAVGDRHDEQTSDHRERGDDAPPSPRPAGQMMGQRSDRGRQDDARDGEVHRGVVVGERLDGRPREDAARIAQLPVPSPGQGDAQHARPHHAGDAGHRVEPPTTGDLADREHDPDEGVEVGSDAEGADGELDADVDDHDRQRRDDHVEGEGREAGVPVGRPPRQPEVRQQLLTQEPGGPHMGTHVAPGRRRVDEPRPRRHRPDQVDRHQRDDPGRRDGAPIESSRLRGRFGPRRAGSGHGDPIVPSDGRLPVPGRVDLFSAGGGCVAPGVRRGRG